MLRPALVPIPLYRPPLIRWWRRWGLMVVVCGPRHVSKLAMSQYIARLVANEHSNGGSTSTVVAVRLSHGRDADNTSHIPKTRGRTDEEFRWRNLRKIPLVLLDIACCKLILLTHSTKFVFLPLFLCFLPQYFLLSIRNAFLCPALRPI